MHNPRAFYEYMNYPIPEPLDFFATEKKTIQQHTIKRKDINPHTERFAQKINKYTRLYKSLPYVKAIYICDGISFNAANENSDIDLFFVVEDGCLRRARLASVILFWILGLKRSFTNKASRFDLIFYTTQSHANIQDIALPYDPYIYHWLSHLIPIYTESDNYDIYRSNKRIYDIFPNLPKHKHIVDIGIYISHGHMIYKKIIEYILGRHKHTIGEKTIQTIRSYIIRQKAKRRKQSISDLILTNNILKFHKDIRSKVAENIPQK